VLVPKVGVRWQPFDDSLTVRATWGEGFHEPSLIESFGSPSQGVSQDNLFDPVTQTRFSEVPFIIRSNRNLQPEDSRSFTAGIVYTPKFVRGLTLTIDLYDIESIGRANIPDLQNVIDRDAIGESLPLEKVDRDPKTGEITKIELAFQNAGSQKARGVDFNLSYQVETAFGTLTWLTQATYLDSFLFAQLPGAAVVELRSGIRPSSPSDDEGYLKWRANSQIDWAWKSFDLTFTAHYLDGFHEILTKTAFNGVPYPNGIKEHWVKQTWFFDVRASYRFLVPSASQAVAGYAKDGGKSSSGKEREPQGSATAQMANCTWQRLLNDTIITLGCNNVFGHDPPTAAGVQPYADFLYDATGRFVYVSLTKRF
jgi:iron complex outermembrane recepter protein